MNINRTWFNFYRDDIPHWPCPACGSASLNLLPELFNVHESSETEKSKEEDWFDADYVRYRFSATLQCANLRCKEVVAVVGSGEVETENIPDEEGRWDTSYRDCFSPKFFEPFLIPISIPENTPIDVRNALYAAFSIIFANRDAAANQLRVSIEVLLDEQNVKAANNLAVRIKNHLIGEFPKYKDRLSALRLIGNDGSHGNGAISISDLLAGLELIESLLIALYPSPSADLDGLAMKMIEKKKPKKTAG